MMRRIEPDWPLAGRIGAFATTRCGGVSRGPWHSFNLGRGCGDESRLVSANRKRLAAALPGAPRWLAQVHGTDVVSLADWHSGVVADAAWTDQPGQVVAILTADCLPILLADRQASVVAGVHGGWRSLAGGIIARTLSALPAPAASLCAWIGPGICGHCYQVGDEVRDAFCTLDPGLAGAFAADGERWRADLKSIAARLLQQAGVEVFDCARCTFEEPQEFYSFRRDGPTGRMASVIWLDRNDQFTSANFQTRTNSQ